MKARDFRLAKLALWGLVLCTGALAVLGVLSLFGDVFRGACIIAFAGIAGFSLCVSQAAAACAQVLDGDKFKHARAWAYAVAVVTGLVSVAGVYLGDAILRGHPPAMPPVWMMVAGGFVLGAVKPAMSFVIAACETKELGRVDSSEDLIRVKDQRIAELERLLRDAQKVIQDKGQPRSAKATSQAGKTLARELRSQEPVGPSKRGETPALEVLEPEASNVSLAELEVACRAIIERRDGDDQPMVPSLRLVASQLNVPRSRVERCLLVANTKLAVVVERLRAA